MRLKKIKVSIYALQCALTHIDLNIKCYGKNKLPSAAKRQTSISLVSTHKLDTSFQNKATILQWFSSLVSTLWE